MKRFMTGLLAFLSFSGVFAQGYVPNSQSVHFRDIGGTSTGQPGGRIKVDHVLSTDTVESNDSLLVIQDGSGNFLYMGNSFQIIPGFYAKYRGFSGDTDNVSRHINALVDYGNGEEYWGGFVYPDNPESGGNRFVIGQTDASFRIFDTLYDKRHGLNLRLPNHQGQGLPGFTLSYYDSARYEAGYTGYPSYSGGGRPHADHYIFDEALQEDIAVHQVEPYNTFSATMYDTVNRIWNEIQITDSVKIFTGTPNWTQPPNSDMALSVSPAKRVTMYGDLYLGTLQVRPFTRGKFVAPLGGTTNTITIPHGLGIDPASVSVTFSDNSDDDIKNYSVATDATNITITFDANPAVASETVHWQAFR